MSAPLCGNRHPGRVGAVLCDNAAGNHPLCTGYDLDEEDFVDWPNPDYVPPPPKPDRKGDAVRMKEIRSKVEPAKRVDGFPAGEAGSQQAARAWTDAEKARVFEAIRSVALGCDEFTTDEIWEELDGSVPVTKGMTAMLMLASRRGILDNTGKTTRSSRGGQHDHGQRLAVWYSLIRTTV